MAYQTIGTYKVFEREIEGVSVWAELEVQQEILVNENKSNFEANLYFYANNNNESERGVSVRVAYDSATYLYLANTFGTNYTFPNGDKLANIFVTLAPGESIIKGHIEHFTTKNVYMKNTSVAYYLYPYHKIDGSISSVCTNRADHYDLTFNGNVHWKVSLPSGSSGYHTREFNEEFNITPTPLTNDRAIYPITANNFTDEQNPVFTYNAVTGTSSVNERPYYRKDSITSIQAALSFDGETVDITYRDIPVDDTEYMFLLTDAERDLLRQKAQGSPNVPIYYLTKVTRTDGTNTATFTSNTQRTLTIVDCEPQLNPTVKDINAKTLALTGNENKFIRYCSTAQFSIGAMARKYATIVSQQVINGAHTVNNLSSGTIENVDSNTFYFAVTDSRNLTTRQALVRDLVPYVKLTSRISAADLGTDGKLTFTVTGNYYNGSFGAKNNSLKFQYGLRVNNGEMTWYNATDTPTFSGNTYTITHTVSGFTYRDQIELTVNIIDEITNAKTNPKVITSIPIFDWSETDFRHRTDVYLDKGKKLMTFDQDDSSLDVIAVNENNGSLTIGNSSADTTIQGDNINLASSNPITINGTTIGANKVLWTGASYMNANQSITLSEAISNQTNGIVLVFSLFRNNSAEDVSINSFFVSKKEVELLSGAPHSFFMLVDAGFSILGAKYLYINDSSISGHEGNTQTGTNSGITFNNSNYVLRYVIGC